MASKTKAGSSQPLLVQGTNDASILSKRSAERTGYFNAPEHLQGLVDADQCLAPLVQHRPQRRAPLINAGYYLRSMFHHQAVDKFLEQHQDSEQVSIVSLGCGFEPSFFRLSKRQKQQQNCVRRVIWVDVDFETLLDRKRNLILAKPDLSSALGSPGSLAYCTPHESSSRVGWSYLMLPADLANTSAFTQQFNDLLPPPQRASPILFISEVSLVYMNTVTSTNLLKAISNPDWLPRSQLWMLEQCVPRHPRDPYASTMFSHFSKLHTPVRNAMLHPTLYDKQQWMHRETRWPAVELKTLLQVFHHWLEGGDQLLRDVALRAVESEPFDEFEELELFMSHYVIITASASSYVSSQPTLLPPKQPSLGSAQETELTTFRRRGHVSAQLAENTILVFGGFGSASSESSDSHGRLAHTSLGRAAPTSKVEEVTGLVAEPSSRLYATLTSLESNKAVLFGGRAGPLHPLNDTWIFDLATQSWAEVHTTNTPAARHRHSAVALDNHRLLIHGGRGRDGRLLDDAHVLDCRTSQWTQIALTFGRRHSHKLALLPDSTVLCIGGLDSSVKAQPPLIGTTGSTEPPKHIQPLSADGSMSDQLHRYSFDLITFPAGSDKVLLIGGMWNHPHPLEQLILFDAATGAVTEAPVRLDERRLLVGHTATLISSGPLRILLTGGGATCYGFGSHFDERLAVLQESKEA